MSTKSDTTVIYSDEHLTLSADLVTSHLIVHTGDSGPSVTTAGHRIERDQIDLIGDGEFRVVHPDGRTIRWRRP